MKVLFDTNILIDYLNGIVQAQQCLTAHPDAAISVITYLEVLAGAKSDDERSRLRQFLVRYPIVPVDAELAEEAAILRQSHGLKTPDALIYACARVQRRRLVTRNSKDFSVKDKDVLIPYSLKLK